MAKSPGVTLIETLLYVALLILLMGSLITITYQTIYATNQINKKIILQQEANFILRKLDWALTGISNITLPALNTTGSELLSTKFNFLQNPLDFTIQNDYLNLSRASADGFPLNTQNTKISNFFVTTSQIAGQTEKIQIGFTLSLTNDSSNSQNFYLTKYLRK